MRLVLASLLVLLPACALAGDPAPPVPHSAAMLIRWHPGVWQPPATGPAPAVGIRLEPESGAAGMPVQVPDALAITRAQAAASVRVAADGSRHAVLGGAMQRYTLVQVGPDGGLVQDCVSSEAEAIRRVGAAATAPSPAADPSERAGPPRPARKEGR